MGNETWLKAATLVREGRVLTVGGKRVWICSPTGSASGDGTIRNPKDFGTLIGTSSPVQPGEQIWLRGGTYTPLMVGELAGANGVNGSATAGKGVYTIKIAGTSGNEIVIRSYPGEWARINGAVHAAHPTAGYLVLRGLEIGATPTTRTFATRADIDFPGVYITAQHIWIDNCYIHDVMQMYIYGAVGLKFTNNVIGLCGCRVTSEGLTGYSIYTHNLNGGTVLFRKNVFIGAFNGYNFGAQSAGSSSILDYDVQYNAFYCGGPLWGSASGTDGNNVFSNNVYYAPTRPSSSYLYVNALRSRGYDNSNGGEDWTVESNVWWMRDLGLPIYYWPKKLTFRNNQIINPQGVFARLAATVNPPEEVDHDYNDYRTTLAGEYRVFTHYGEPTAITLADWRSLTGWDLNSTHTIGLPGSNVVRVWKDDYADGRGLVVILNYTNASQVTVDLSALNIADGAYCRMRNCINWDEYQDFIYDASSPTVTIAMSDSVWTVKAPTANDTGTLWRTGLMPDFGAFKVETI